LSKVIFSFFSGSGFLDLGFETSDYKIVFVNEFHRPFVDAYKHSRKKMGIAEPEYGYHCCDIDDFLTNYELLSELKHQINIEKDKGNLVGFIGGPPCPDFSIGGKNKGKEGENGRLTESYIDLICLCKPDYFMFENVKGLWRTKRHREFYDAMKDKLEQNQYSLSDRLTNSIEFGAPQDRDRIILFGVGAQKLPNSRKNTELSDLVDWNIAVKYNRDDVLNYSWPTTSEFVQNTKTQNPNDKYEDLTIQFWFDKNDISNHPNSKHHFQPRAGLAKFEVIDEGDVGKKSYKRLHRWRYSPTAAYGNNEVHLHPYFARRLSAAEALAIQSLPKKFELPSDMTLSNMFKTIGNGVPFQMSKGIASVLNNVLEKL